LRIRSKKPARLSVLFWTNCVPVSLASRPATITATLLSTRLPRAPRAGCLRPQLAGLLQGREVKTGELSGVRRGRDQGLRCRRVAQDARAQIGGARGLVSDVFAEVIGVAAANI